MSLFGERFSRKENTQHDLYRKYRGDGMGIFRAYKKAKADVSSIMLKKTTHENHHDNRYHHHHNKQKYHHKYHHSNHKH
jgi:hypothetical protein